MSVYFILGFLCGNIAVIIVSVLIGDKQGGNDEV